MGVRMKVTNKHNLPQAMENFAKKMQRKPVEGRIGITRLIGPPLIPHYLLKEWDNLSVDVSELIWAINGTAVHKVLEGAGDDNSFIEEKLTAERGGVTISGIADLWKDRTIEDYKNTSVYAVMNVVKPEWKHQLFGGAWLFKQHGFDTDKGRIHAILRDWSRARYLREAKDGYPPVPFKTIEVEIPPYEVLEDYIHQRLEVHKNPLGNICTDEERWAKGGKFALMKKGRKKAVKLFESEGDLKKHSPFGDKDPFYIEERPKEYVRCQDYCPVREVCEYREV
jgi:hypothetical protein